MSVSPGVPLHPESLAPGTRLGRWRVAEALGTGGQGAVYRVEDLEHPGTFYALKLALRAEDGRAEREQLLLSARAAHPHVVRFHGCAHGPPPREELRGFVMDWAPGRALDVWAEEAGTTFRQFALASATVADTLGELHARGVFHRDLKPEHILIRAEDGQPVLLDFGASWYAGAPPLTPGPLPPTTRYLLSPEAVHFLWRSAGHPGARYDFRPEDDLYALGVCLYRATTGRYPFSEWLSPDVMLWAIAHVPPRAPGLVNPRVPRALNDIIVRLLAKDPRERYPSGTALHAALREAIRGTETAWEASLFEREAEAVRPSVPRPARTPCPEPLARPRPEARWRRGAVGLGLAAALLWGWGASVPPHLWGACAPSAQLPTQGQSGPVPAQGGQAPRPAPEQKRAPCKAQLEVEVSGACWHAIEQRPCPPETVAHQGQCLWPVPRPPRVVPTSVKGSGPENP